MGCHTDSLMHGLPLGCTDSRTAARIPGFVRGFVDSPADSQIRAQISQIRGFGKTGGFAESVGPIYDELANSRIRGRTDSWIHGLADSRGLHFGRFADSSPYLVSSTRTQSYSILLQSSRSILRSDG